MDKIIEFLFNIIDSPPTIQYVHCDKWFGRNKIEYHPLTTGINVPVCAKCWVEINKYCEVE